MNIRFIQIMDKYEDMTEFLSAMINNQMFKDSYVEHDPLVQDLLKKIKEFHDTLVGVFSVSPEDAGEFYQTQEEFSPDEITNGE